MVRRGGCVGTAGGDWGAVHIILMAGHGLCVGRVTGTNDPIANLAQMASRLGPGVVVYICICPLPPPFSLSAPLSLFLSLYSCVAFITESHFNHRIFDLLPFDTGL